MLRGIALFARNVSVRSLFRRKVRRGTFRLFIRHRLMIFLRRMRVDDIVGSSFLYLLMIPNALHLINNHGHVTRWLVSLAIFVRQTIAQRAFFI